MSAPRYAINARVDALLCVLDEEQRRLGVTSGEQVVLLTVALAGALARAVREEPRIFHAALGLLLSYSVDQSSERAKRFYDLLALLAKLCDVSDEGEACRAES